MGKGKGKGNFLRKPSYSPFVPNFVAMTTGVGRGKMQLAAFDGPSPKTPLYAQKSLTRGEL